MGQLNLHIEDEIKEAFVQFCKRQGTTPYKLLASIIGFYGRGEILKQKRDNKAISDEEVLVELGRIVADMQQFAKANGDFLEPIAVLFKRHGVRLSSLWPSWEEPGGRPRLKNRKPPEGSNRGAKTGQT